MRDAVGEGARPAAVGPRARFGRAPRGWVLAFAVASAPLASLADDDCPRLDVPPDWVTAVQEALVEHRSEALTDLYRDYVEAGDARMQADLGFLVEQGIAALPSGGDRTRAALRLFRSAALCGDHLAIRRLALAYQLGELGLDRDGEMAACLFDIGSSGRSAAGCGLGSGE